MSVLSRWRNRLRIRRALEAAARQRYIWHPTAANKAKLRERRDQVAAAQRVIARHAPSPPPAPTIKARPKSARARAVDVAQAYANKGIVEHPAGSNGGPYISGWQQAFGFARVPWCGIFCGTVLREVGVKNVSGRIAGVALIEQDAKAHNGPFRGWTTGRSGVTRGDLAVIGGYGVHVELITDVHGDGSLSTVGGNTSYGPGGSQSNGGCVAIRRRSPGEIRGCALVNFPG